MIDLIHAKDNEIISNDTASIESKSSPLERNSGARTTDNDNNNSNSSATTSSITSTSTTSNVNNTQPKRVKVYILENDEWKDTGTGFCIGEIITKQQQTNSSSDVLDKKLGQIKNQMIMITRKNCISDVTDEEYPSNILLESKLEGNIEYQRQEETLIVWKDLLGHDIALSFEESIGCDTLCEFIVQVQRNIENNISLVAVKSNDNGVGSIHEIITGPVVLPICDEIQTYENLIESLKVLNDNLSFEFLKNETIEFVLHSHYIDLLIRLFEKAENEKLIKNLLVLSNIIKTLMLYNQRDIIEVMIDDDHIEGIVGILEYDTEFPFSKANHRKSLSLSDSTLKEVIPLENKDLKTIIKKCFRLQFLKDVVLVRFLDDHNFNLILDIILDLETCIIDFLEVDPFLDKIIELYHDNDEDRLKGEKQPSELRKNGIRLLHQCVQVSKNLDPLDKSKFFKTLVRKGLFNVLYYAFHVETDSDIRILATDMIITIIEHDILLINNVQNEKFNNNNNKVMEEDGNNSTTISSCDMSLLSILSTIIQTDKNFGLREQVAQALTTLLHPEGCLGGEGIDLDMMDEQISSNLDMLSSDLQYDLDQDVKTKKKSLRAPSQENTTIKNIPSDFQVIEYFNNFYEHIAPKLFKPLISKYKSPRPNTHDYDDNLLIHLVKLISFIASEHNRALSRKFILENGILQTLSAIIKNGHMLQLKLTCIRCFKNLICLDDKYYHRYMISNSLFDPIMQLLKINLEKDNLMNSCIQDFFKIISYQCLENNNNIDTSKEKGLNHNDNDRRFSDHTDDMDIISKDKQEQRQLSKSHYKKTNFTILNRYLLERYGDLIEKLGYIPFIKDMIIFNKEQIILETIEKEEPINLDEHNESTLSTSVNGNNNSRNENVITNDDSQSVNSPILKVGGKRLHSQVDSFVVDSDNGNETDANPNPNSSLQEDGLLFKKSIDCHNLQRGPSFEH
ncbi:Psy2p NDAI_0F03570 [Naumovozyma dairenensis CBS 421]|uniref:Uncharacterized protein n=1 Tax=Naumovozyma dairenensis (strain ATCC 10597 / BCRC 20456 / CBS 421 / NBRC 0211 / NRRL Y-12639) TaxID=1071378 RepID=G0WD14_NAUDC|nr:hypothetical protein NDAI_0F03570 [Naumovozyma dairenensis CBS 421]CCD25675.1 hypothetical protein NDAI_0F03570 [Naumovozyma dairenensis CBS 421]